MTARPIRHAGGVFRALTDELVGEELSFADLDLSRYPAPLVEEARRAWQERVRTEFRSIQIMSRFMTEVLGAGDPLEVWAGAADLVQDEVRHVRLCVSLVEALGATPAFPDSVELRDPEPYLKAPMPERALHTAISMLAINETLSVAFIEDLRARCEEPAVRRVLDATLEDEEGHQEFGWEYVATSLRRFPVGSLASWRHLVEVTLEPHRRAADRALERVPPSERKLEAHPDTERVGLGLFSPARQALVMQRCMEETLLPRLRKLELA